MLFRTATAVTGSPVGIFSPISWRNTSSATGFHNRRGFALVSAARGGWAGAVGSSTILNQAKAKTREGAGVENFILEIDNAGVMVKPPEILAALLANSDLEKGLAAVGSTLCEVMRWSCSSAKIVRDPEDDDHNPEHFDSGQHTQSRATAVGLRDGVASIAAQEYQVRHIRQQRARDDIDDIVLLGVQRRDADERRIDERGDSQPAMDAITRQSCQERVRDVERGKAIIRPIRVVNELQTPRKETFIDH